MDTQSVSLVAGWVFSLIGWGTLVHFAWIVRHWPSARGRVVENSAEWSQGNSSGRSAVYFPVIEFFANGRVHRAKGGVGRTSPWEKGEMVQLHYDQSNPDHILDFNLWQRLAFSGAFIGFGAAALAAAFGWLS